MQKVPAQAKVVDSDALSQPTRHKLCLCFAWPIAGATVDLLLQIQELLKQYPSVKEGAKAHSSGKLKFPSSQTLLARNGAV